MQKMMEEGQRTVGKFDEVCRVVQMKRKKITPNRVDWYATETSVIS